MKKIIPALLVLVVVCGCWQKPKITYIFKANNAPAEVTKAKIDSTVEVLKARLVTAGYKKPLVTFDEGLQQFKIEVVQKSDDSFIKSGLLNNCDVFFYEMYLLEDIGTMIVADKKNQDIFFKYISPSNDSRRAEIGVAKINDTAAFFQHIKPIQDILPPDCFFAYGQKFGEGNDKYVGLFALKNNEHQVYVNNKLLSAKTALDGGGHPCIRLNFNGTGTAKFAKMTRDNIGSPIAIVVNGSVYSAPFVNGEVSGGSAEIAGNFTEAQVIEMANTIAAGSLPLSLKQIN